MAIARNQNPVTQAEYEALAEMRHALRCFLRFSEDAAVAAGLTPQQHQALLAIKGFPGRGQISIGELAERLQIRHHSAVGLANRLVARQWALRRHDTTDRRQVRLRLTSRGEQILETLSRAHREQLRSLAPRLASLFTRLGGKA